MPEPESNSPSFDFLSDLAPPKSDEPAAAGDEAMFDFGKDASPDKPVEPPVAETPPAESEAPCAGVIVSEKSAKAEAPIARWRSIGPGRGCPRPGKACSLIGRAQRR